MTGWWYTYPSEKYEFVNGKDYPTMEKYTLCLKPPTKYKTTMGIHMGKYRKNTSVNGDLVMGRG